MAEAPERKDRSVVRALRLFPAWLAVGFVCATAARTLPAEETANRKVLQAQGSSDRPGLVAASDVDANPAEDLAKYSSSELFAGGEHAEGQGDIDLATIYYRELIRRFAGSPRAKSAVRKLKVLQPPELAPEPEILVTKFRGEYDDAKKTIVVELNIRNCSKGELFALFAHVTVKGKRGQVVANLLVPLTRRKTIDRNGVGVFAVGRPVAEPVESFAFEVLSNGKVLNSKRVDQDKPKP